MKDWDPRSKWRIENPAPYEGLRTPLHMKVWEPRSIWNIENHVPYEWCITSLRMKDLRTLLRMKYRLRMKEQAQCSKERTEYLALNEKLECIVLNKGSSTQLWIEDSNAALKEWSITHRSEWRIRVQSSKWRIEYTALNKEMILRLRLLDLLGFNK